MRRRCMRTRCTRFARRRGTAASGRSIFRCSPTDSRRSASRGSRRRVPLFRHRTPQVHPRRHAGSRADTRNMATGASTADLAILLVDAAHGVRPQSRRHARIAGLLGIEEFVLAVNKMDLVDFSARRLRRHSPRIRGSRRCRMPRRAAQRASWRQRHDVERQNAVVHRPNSARAPRERDGDT